MIRADVEFLHVGQAAQQQLAAAEVQQQASCKINFACPHYRSIIKF